MLVGFGVGYSWGFHLICWAIVRPRSPAKGQSLPHIMISCKIPSCHCRETDSNRSLKRSGEAASALGKAALLPWDTEIFGFPVALFRVGDEAPDNAIRKDVAPHFSSWMMHHEVSVCGCVLPAGNVFWKSFLPTLGFRFVDFAIEARLRDLSSATLPPVRAVLRNPQRGDQGAIEALAARSFAHGRYFADPLFPRDLAQRRYKRWVANALAEANGPDRVYVLGEPGSVNGFFHVAVQGHEADLRLASIAPECQGTGMGFDLYISVLHELKNLGYAGL